MFAKSQQIANLIFERNEVFRNFNQLNALQVAKTILLFI